MKTISPAPFAFIACSNWFGVIVSTSAKAPDPALYSKVSTSPRSAEIRRSPGCPRGWDRRGCRLSDGQTSHACQSREAGSASLRAGAGGLLRGATHIGSAVKLHGDRPGARPLRSSARRAQAGNPCSLSDRGLVVKQRRTGRGPAERSSCHLAEELSPRVIGKTTASNWRRDTSWLGGRSQRETG